MSTAEDYAARVAARWAATDPTVRSFWQSPLVMAEINRRVSGDREVTPLEYFRRRYCPEPRGIGLSLGSGDGQLEIAAVQAGVCERIVGIDLSPERIEDLETRMEPVEATDYGGALFHQCFNRLMGNFAGEPALVRAMMELDFLLTDAGVLAPNYLWGVYRPKR